VCSNGQGSTTVSAHNHGYVLESNANGAAASGKAMLKSVRLCGHAASAPSANEVPHPLCTMSCCSVTLPLHRTALPICPPHTGPYVFTWLAMARSCTAKCTLCRLAGVEQPTAAVVAPRIT